jgi:uncharacterized protein (TIGR03067 family)
MHTVIVLAVGLLIAADDVTDDCLKKESDTFQGTWALMSAERDGKKISDADKTIKLEITGTRYRLIDVSSAVIGHRGTFLLDPTRKAKATDMTVTEGNDKGKTFLGIYELSANDYKVCIAPSNRERPKEFASKPGSGNVLQVWRRERKWFDPARFPIPLLSRE